jgi:cell division protein FtsL
MKKFLSTILVLVLFMSIYIIPVNAKGEIYVQKDISYIQSKSQLISLYDSMQKMKESDLQ